MSEKSFSPDLNSNDHSTSGAGKCPFTHGAGQSASSNQAEASATGASDPKTCTALSGKAAAYKISRRGMLIGGGTLAALGVGLGAVGGFSSGKSYGLAKAKADHDVMNLHYPFSGKHQSGIITPQPQQMFMAAYDVTSRHREDLIQLLKDWSLAANKMMRGELIKAYKTFKEVPPDDTGETGDLGPAALTITFGFGATLFKTTKGEDRFGIAQHLPAPLAAGIPRMAAEKLDPQQCGGDLVVQACAEDPMVALHAIHNLTRIAFGRAALRWSQLGYGRTASTSTSQKTPRNLFGFKDGTSNIRAEEGENVLNKHLWINPQDAGGKIFAGGSYLCIRKIKQFMEVWDELVLNEQEQTIGRFKESGAPLSGGDEFTEPDFNKKDENGELLIPADSHIAMVHPTHNNGARMLRRGYNYMEGNDRLGRLEGGLFFIAYVRNPENSFIPVLQQMAKDALTEYLQHLSSSLFLIPPGASSDSDYVGSTLFNA